MPIRKSGDPPPTHAPKPTGGAGALAESAPAQETPGGDDALKQPPPPRAGTTALHMTPTNGTGAATGRLAQLVALSHEPRVKQSTAVVYPDTVDQFGALSEKALDLVEGPYSQRARRHARGLNGDTGPQGSYAAVMSEVQSGALKLLLADLKAKLEAAHAKLGLPQEPRPGLAHLMPIYREAVLTLAPHEQALLTNGAGNFASQWLDFSSTVHNSLSLAFHAAMDDDGKVDRSALLARLGPELGGIAVNVLDKANAGFAQKSPAQQHWASGERSPYEPDDRPITRRDLLSLRFKDRKLHDALIAAAPIPKALPVLDASANADPTRFDDCQMLLVQHALGSIVPFTQKLIDKGARPGDIDFVPVPYSTNAIVAHHLEEKGIKIHDSCPDGAIAPRDVETVMERDVFSALQSAVKKAKASGKRLVVVDDGGIVVRLLAGRAKTLGKPQGRYGLDDDGYRDFLMQVRDLPVLVVEQTTRGITEANELKGALPRGVTLVDMARSRAKAYEGPMVGRDAHRVLERALTDLGKGGLSGKTVAIIGYGVIGSAVAKAMRDAGARVVITDVDADVRARAAADGFEVEDEIRDAIADKDLVVGCSGHRSVQHDDFFSLKRGAVVASLSSKAMELFTDHLEGQMSASVWPMRGQGPGEAPVARYGRAFSHHQVVEWDPNDDFHQAVYTLVNNGCPATFTGQVNCVPPEDIQLTEAIKLEALMQAVSLPPGQGIVALEEHRQERVLAAMDRYRPGWR